MLPRQISASLIISFYKNIHALKVILAALELQSFKEFEVIIADDGSPAGITEEIARMRECSPFPLKHTWHEDRGFRKTTILNKAAHESESPYIIFMDGDCIPHRRFIEGHVREREAGAVLAGRRVNLSARLSQKLEAGKVRGGYLGSPRFLGSLLIDGVFGKSNHVEKGLYLSIPFLKRAMNRKDAGVLGCNFSLWKEDFLDINGFDERYLAPAVGEDTDIETRLRWNNIRVKTVKNIAIQYHLHHRQQERMPVNQEIYAEVLRSGKAFTPYGINKTRGA